MFHCRSEWNRVRSVREGKEVPKRNSFLKSGGLSDQVRRVEIEFFSQKTSLPFSRDLLGRLFYGTERRMEENQGTSKKFSNRDEQLTFQNNIYCLPLEVLFVVHQNYRKLVNPILTSTRPFGHSSCGSIYLNHRKYEV